MTDVLLLGDSQMSGLSRTLVPKLQAAGYRTVGVGIRVGWSTQAFINADIALPRNDLTIIALGGNDEPRSQTRYAEQLDRFLTKYVRPGTRVIWWGPAHALDADVQLKHNETADLQRAILSGRVQWIDSRNVTHALPFAPDGVHFTAEGYRRWADEVLKSVRGNSEIRWGWLLAGAGAVYVGIKYLRAA